MSRAMLTLSDAWRGHVWCRNPLKNQTEAELLVRPGPHHARAARSLHCVPVTLIASDHARGSTASAFLS